MWSLSSYVSHVVLIIPKPHASLPPRLVVSATKGNDNNIGALGRTILTAVESNPTTAQVSGSDVLWAVNKLAEKKKKKNNKKTRRTDLLSSTGGLREEVGGVDNNDDDDHVRPLVLKREWSEKLAELEKRLGELYHTK